MNKVFPNWENADTVIPYLLDKRYGLIYRPDFDYNNTIKLSLLPLSEKDLGLIPAEYQYLFQGIVSKFTKLALYKSNVNLENYLFIAFSEKSLNDMVLEMETDMRNYETINKVSIKEELGKALGYDSNNNIKLEIIDKE